MRKHRFITVICSTVFLMIAICCNGFIAYAKDQNKKVILIDPGHGGLDGGAVSKNGTVEKGINLEISKKLKECLEKKGYKVYLTREDDLSLENVKGTVRRKKVDDLNNRCKMKLEVNCDAFVSIHLNMFPNAKARGAQVWYSDYENSKILANDIQDSFKEYVEKDNNRIPKAAYNQYKVLRDKYPAPCVIVECGFLSNPEEEKLLKSEEYQKKVAEAIAKGVDKYFTVSKK